MIEKFKKYYQEEKEILKKKIDNYNNKLIIEDNPIIKENLEYFSKLNTNGKLIRGVLTDLGYYLLNDNREYSNDLALAYEIFQTAILVHDDIIDQDEKRRGINTIHFENYNKYKKYNKLEAKHLSESIAICIGDYGLYQANMVISNAYKDDSNLSKVLINFNDTILKTIKGEMLDVVLPFKSKNINIDESLEESIIDIYRLKTSYYTIIGPLSVGLLLAGADSNKIEDITNFGEKVGIAFQIQDDILGIYSEEIGKVIGSDIKEFKQTILYSHISKTDYINELNRYYGKDLSNENINKVRELFKESGSYDYAINMMNKMYDESISILNNTNWIDESKKNILKGFVEYLRNRNK
ncbi:MAG: polyprenyl synthetase family protein [Bacilli bacterium]|nr:polyprenyl synthetase family protein [Bacilli bacterium]